MFRAQVGHRNPVLSAEFLARLSTKKNGMYGVESNSNYEDAVRKYFSDLFSKAMHSNQYEFLLTLLRVTGMSDAGWDPLEESLKAIDDMNEMLAWASSREDQKLVFRIGLMMYCHLVEMNAVPEVLINLQRCATGEHHHLAPFLRLGRRSKKNWSVAPPSAKSKLNALVEYAEEKGDKDLSALIDAFFDDDLRNAFTHSDYNITDETLNTRGNGFGRKIPLQEVSDKIHTAFQFYGEFLKCWKAYRMDFAKNRRIQKLPNYETLEILYGSETITGFRIHFSNGSAAHFERNGKVVATNLSFERDGSISYFVGDLGTLEKVWKLNGVRVDDWDKINLPK